MSTFWVHSHSLPRPPPLCPLSRFIPIHFPDHLHCPLSGFIPIHFPDHLHCPLSGFIPIHFPDHLHCPLSGFIPIHFPDLLHCEATCLSRGHVIVSRFVASILVTARSTHAFSAAPRLVIIVQFADRLLVNPFAYVHCVFGLDYLRPVVCIAFLMESGNAGAVCVLTVCRY